MVKKEERKALYPGSFDPPTNGHQWVIEQMAGQFDAGVAAIGINPDKSGRFPVSDRMEMLTEIVAQFPNIAVSSFLGLLQADYAEMIGAKYLVRGTRNAVDFGFESDARHINATINPNLQTVVYVPPKELLQVSSSMVMGLVGFEGWQSEVAKMVPESVLKRLERRQNEKDMEMLHQRFQSLCNRVQAKGDVETTFNFLYHSYLESHRFYHTPNHLKTCLNELELVRNLTDDPNVLEFAIFYHDVIYNSAKPNREKVGNDEERSAQLAETDLMKKLGIPREIASRVGPIIMATKHDKVPTDNDAKLMVDIDLAIFGRSERLFDIYEQQIRQEYYWVPFENYCLARKKILQKFFDRGIYHTDFFRNRYENQARKNLQRSITNLSEGLLLS